MAFRLATMTPHNSSSSSSGRLRRLRTGHPSSPVWPQCLDQEPSQALHPVSALPGGEGHCPFSANTTGWSHTPGFRYPQASEPFPCKERWWEVRLPQEGRMQWTWRRRAAGHLQEPVPPNETASLTGPDLPTDGPSFWTRVPGQASTPRPEDTEVRTLGHPKGYST